MSQSAEAVLCFEGFTLDLSRGELRDGDGEIKLRAKSFELLRHLASNAGRIASKDELVQAVWGKAVVSDESIARCVSDIRAALRDVEGKIITTVPRRGYRFSAQVQPVARPTTGGAQLIRPLPPRLSIVVLPFVNMGGGADQEHFVDGVTESLTTDLSRIHGSFVIARNTAVAFKARALDLKHIGRELNVRYVLEGSVQRSAKQIRVNVQLIDAESSHHLWAERFDKPIGDLFDMQDDIVTRLASALNAELIAAEALRAERTPTPDSMDLQFQAQAWNFRGMSPDNTARARDLCERALTLDPGNIEALVTSAWADAIASVIHVGDFASGMTAAEAKLTRALNAVPNHANAHLALGFVYNLTKRAKQGIAECEHALRLNRNLAMAHSQIGLGKVFIGRPEETEAYVLESLRLSPRDTLAYIWMTTAAMAKNQLRLWEDTVNWCRRAIEVNRGFFQPHCELAMALAQLGRLDEARVALNAGLEFFPGPGFTISVARNSWTAMSDEPAYLAALDPQFESLRRIGVPE